MAQCIPCRHAASEIYTDQSPCTDNHQQIPFDLFHLQGVLYLLHQDQIVGIEIDTKKQHEDADHPLNIGGVFTAA